MLNKILIFSTEFKAIDFFLGDLINKLAADKIDISTFSNNHSNHPQNLKHSDHIINYNFMITRKPNLIIDFFTFIKTFFIIFKNKPDLILSITPKAGFLIALSKIFSKSISIHFFTGQVWFTKKGFSRFIYKLCDKIICNLSDEILVDSNSQINFLISEGFPKNKLKLILNGSISGVNIDRFNFYSNHRDTFRNSNNLNNNNIVLLFLGRFNKDKGLNLLLNTFKSLQNKYPNLVLVLNGTDEENFIRNSKLNSMNNLIILNHSITPEIVYSGCDIFCLPSYREGFGLSVVEASSCRLPVVISDTYGLNDSIINNHTGLIFKSGNSNDLETKLQLLITDRNKRIVFGNNGRDFVIKKFNKKNVVDFLYHFITNKLLF